MNPWVAGARLRTLPASVSPVLVGTAVAAAEGPLVWWRAGAALIVALALQVGVNYANDYSDGKRGTDDNRVGPLRLVGSGVAAPEAVRTMALAWLAAGMLAGVLLV
ncbi:MAG: UbiA family prenyltransferase, partial [Acidimicrobiia bacterium]